MTRTSTFAGRTYVSDAPAYRVVTSITEPGGDTYRDYVKDYATFSSALADYEAQTCSLRVIGHALVRMSDGATLERKGWLYGHASGNFQFSRGRPKLRV